MLDFSNLIARHETVIKVFKETGGRCNYEKGGEWESEVRPEDVKAAVFNLTARDISSAIQYNEGGAFTKNDVKIYTHEQLPIGAKITHKDKAYTISTEFDYSEHACGLRVYIAKGADALNGTA